MNKFLIFFLLIVLSSGCSFNKESSFWSAQNIEKENDKKYKKIFVENKTLGRELNPNLKIGLINKIDNDQNKKYYFNNDGRLNYDGDLKKSSRYKFSKISNFNKFEPVVTFYKDNIIFFDNKGSILKFDKKSKLIWKKSYYSKTEKKLNPILQLSSKDNFLIVADNIAKYYMVDLISGNLIWSRNNLAPFNSQIKIFKDKFFIIDSSNTLRCFSIKNGEELWNVKTEDSLIRSQKKLSMVIVNETLYFNNSIGDISAVNIEKGELLWQLPTQSNLIYEAAFSLETSDIITDTDSLFFSNNKNQFFSIDISTGTFNWTNTVNSNVRPTLIGNYLITVSIEGYLIIIEKNSGNILKVTDIFNNFKETKRDKIQPTGFVVGLNNIYLSTNNGRLLVIDLKSGKTVSVLKIDNEKISRPFVSNKDLYLVKDNAVIKLN